MVINKEWTDVGNAAVYFDLKDYPNFSEARFEGFIKSLNGYEAAIDSGRIKLILK